MKHLFLILLLFTTQLKAQKVFHTNEKSLTIKVNGKVTAKNWNLNSEVKPDVFLAEVTANNNTVVYSDGKDSIQFSLKKDQTIDFLIIQNKIDTAYQRIVAVKPNVNFTKEYIKKYNGKTEVAIPEVSELLNILMALHPEAEKEGNMFDTKTEYYQKAKHYFQPYLNHPALDTIKKYITDIKHIKEHDIYMFSNPSYRYYYALKMNACAYHFDKKGNIVNDGFIREMAPGWYTFDPMKDKEVFEDFARISNFRQFYKDNQPYYTELLKTYTELNPIQQMQSWLDKKFEFGYGSYAVYFSPLIYGAHSTQKFASNNFSQTIMFIARADFDKELTPIHNELRESRVVFTEIDHNYVNPVSDTFLEHINKSLSNREKWAKGVGNDMYKSPYMVFNEYMTFGVYSLYISDNYTEQDVIKYLPELEESMGNTRGFIQFKAFNQELLSEYKKNPSIKITDLYKHMLDWCAKHN